MTWRPAAGPRARQRGRRYALSRLGAAPFYPAVETGKYAHPVRKPGSDSYGQGMLWWSAALWGLAGGGASTVVSLTAAVKAAGYTWPWRTQGELGPWLFVLAAGLLLGGGVAAAASGELSGPWPAFAFGVGSPTIVRGLLAGVEVTPLPEEPSEGPTREPQPTTSPVVIPRRAPEGNVHEDAR